MIFEPVFKMFFIIISPDKIGAFALVVFRILMASKSSFIDIGLSVLTGSSSRSSL